MLCSKGFPYIVIRTLNKSNIHCSLVYLLFWFICFTPQQAGHIAAWVIIIVGIEVCQNDPQENMMTYLFGCTCLLFWAMSSQIIYGLFDKSNGNIIEK